MNSIEFDNITYRADKHAILSSVSGLVEAGEKFAIVGENGSGKSTLLAILLGDVIPTSGEIYFGTNGNTKIRSCRYGVVYDHMPLFPLLTAAELLNYISILQRVKISRSERMDILSRFDLQAIAHRKVKVLSAGEKQRVALMLAVVHNPDLLILDEAFSNVDPIFIEEIWQYIARPNRTVVFTSHNWDVIWAHATKILFLHNGRCLGEPLSPLEHLRKAPSNKKIVAKHSKPLIQKLESASVAWYGQEGVVNVFPPGSPEASAIINDLPCQTESVSLKDIFMLYKEGKI